MFCVKIEALNCKTRISTEMKTFQVISLRVALRTHSLQTNTHTQARNKTKCYSKKGCTRETKTFLRRLVKNKKKPGETFFYEIVSVKDNKLLLHFICSDNRKFLVTEILRNNNIK